MTFGIKKRIKKFKIELELLSRDYNSARGVTQPPQFKMSSTSAHRSLF